MLGIADFVQMAVIELTTTLTRASGAAVEEEVGEEIAQTIFNHAMVAAGTAVGTGWVNEVCVERIFEY